MNQYSVPEVGRVYNLGCEAREVVGLRFNRHAAYPDVVYKNLEKNKIRSIWLPFWSSWLQDEVLTAEAATDYHGHVSSTQE